jgi:PAS domain S-box-containing protein
MGITDGEVLRAVLEAARVRVAAMDRSGRLLLDPDPNPPLPGDVGAPVGGNFLEIYGDVWGVEDAVRAAFAGEEVRIVRPRGDAVYTGCFVPRRGPTGEVDAVFAVATASGEGSLLERSLAETNVRERRLFNSNMVGLAYWNRDGAITDANDVFLGIVGYTREDLRVGRVDWRAMTPPEYRARDERAMREMREKGACMPFEKEYIRKDGQRVSVLIGGATLEPEQLGVAFVVDISDHKRLERARREAEQALRQVVDSSPIVLWSVDDAGIFTLSRGGGLHALGLEPGQVVGRSVFDVYADIPELLNAVRRSLQGEEFRNTLEVAGLVFDSLFTPLQDAAGRVTGVLGVSMDVTARHRAEVEQSRLREQLVAMQKLESLGILAGGIAHDFNNLLTPILVGASTALLSIPLDNPVREDLDNVITAAHRAAELTRQMLAYSGRAHVQIRPIDLSGHVREIAALLETTMPKKVQLRLELEPGLPAIQADVAQVQQIVMNLVINAAEAIGDQPGTVLVNTGAQHVGETAAATLLTADGLMPGEYVFVRVRDTGHGMDEATQGKIFDPFFTTKFTGRGLGLAAVLGIVRGHRGAISIDSSPGQGSTFKVFFPTASASIVADDLAVPGEYRSHGLLLVIDDDAGVRSAMRRILERFGFSVMEAEDGRRGADLFAVHAGDIALVILDMTMPKMNGEETFRAIRCLRADVPVILTSGYSEIEMAGRFSALRFAGFLEKPFTPAILAEKLARILPPG